MTLNGIVHGVACAALVLPSLAAADCPSTIAGIVESYVESCASPEALERLLADDFRSEAWAPAGYESALPVPAGKRDAIASAQELSDSGMTLSGGCQPNFRVSRTSIPGEWIIENVQVHLELAPKSGEVVTMDRDVTFRVRATKGGACYEIVQLVTHIQ